LRNAPPKERDGEGYKGDLGFRKIRIFFQKGLDRGTDNHPGDLPVGLLPVGIGEAGKRFEQENVKVVSTS
jgi:hypothetical protein